MNIINQYLLGKQFYLDWRNQTTELSHEVITLLGRERIDLAVFKKGFFDMRIEIFPLDNHDNEDVFFSAIEEFGIEHFPPLIENPIQNILSLIENYNGIQLTFSDQAEIMNIIANFATLKSDLEICDYFGRLQYWSFDEEEGHTSCETLCYASQVSDIIGSKSFDDYVFDEFNDEHPMHKRIPKNINDIVLSTHQKSNDSIDF